MDVLAPAIESVFAVTKSGRPVPGAAKTVAITDLASIPALPADTVAINVAAYRYVAKTFKADQEAILSENVALAQAFFAFCVQRGIKEARLASSMAVYPAAWPVADDEAPLDLNAWPHDGEAAYAWSKRWSEIVAELYRRQFGVNTTIFRLTNPYGPYDATDIDAVHVAPAFAIKALLPGPTFEVLGNPEAERDFVFAGDIANVFLASLGVRARNDAYNIAAGQTTTIRDLAAAAIEGAGVRKEIVAKGAAGGGGVNVRRATGAKFRRDFTTPPFTPLEQGMKRTIDWYRNVLG
jgi:nucleoside-diphosphate-sugar epimerase